MSTPTIVRFQIAVPSTDGSAEATEKVYTLALSLLVEGGCEDDGRIKVMLAGDESTGDPTLVPPSDVMPPKEPPPPN